MKRLTATVLALCLLIGWTGCGTQVPQETVSFYYLRSQPRFSGDDGVLAPEARLAAGLDLENPAEVLNAYLEGPESAELESPVPRDTAVVEVKRIHDSLHINFSSEFSQLSGIDLTLACACVSRTCMELCGVDTVRIRANGALLNGSTYVVMSRENLKLADDALDKLRTELTVYYTDAQRRYLIAHTVSVNLANEDDVLSYLVNQLLTPPEGLGLVSPLPEGTRLLSCRVSDGLCTLDLSQEFEQNAFSQSFAQRTTLLSLVNTLTQLEEVERVEFYLEGNLMARYQELTLSRALVFEEDAIGPVRTGMNEYDATLYLANGSELYLAAVPVRIRAAVGVSPAEQVVKQLLEYQNPNGFYCTIPVGTVLNDLEITQGLCTIDLSGAFLSDTEHLLLSVHSIVASVCALEGIDEVLITVNGTRPEGEFGDLFLPMSPGSDWYL